MKTVFTHHKFSGLLISSSTKAEEGTSYLVTLFSLEQNNFFPGTQAFASPPDLASSGVWENIILSKTPTFDGV